MAQISRVVLCQNSIAIWHDIKAMHQAFNNENTNVDMV